MTTLTLDVANCFAARVGEQGLPDSLMRDRAGDIAKRTQQLNASRGTGWERWRLLPFEPLRSQHTEPVHRLAAKYHDRTENLVVLGIGGSALGNIALQAALNPLMWNLQQRGSGKGERNGPRIFVLDNVDPHLVGQTIALLEGLDPGLEHTLVNVISKSGETAETAAQFMIFRHLMQQRLGERFPQHIIATTDPEQGTMRSICDAEGYATLPVPEGVGGRFSVLSPVGLFSAAMCGIDIEALLDGAAAMDEQCQLEQLAENPAAQLALILVEFMQREKRNVVMMPYSNNLYLMADWFRQLWAESLGKREDIDGNIVFAGGTPIKALGATDQHSQVQLYREGPNDKVFCMLEVLQFDDTVRVPDDLDVESLRYLHGASLTDLLNAEKRATEYALVENERPNMTIRFPRIDAHAVGAFIQLWEIATAFAGQMLNINAFDQPAVETGKVATFGLMGRPGYDEWRAKVDQTLSSTVKV